MNYYFVAITSLLLMILKTEAQRLSASSDLSISNETSTSFTLTFTNISGAVEYEIFVTSLHERTDNITFRVQRPENLATINNRRSNTNYIVEVRGVDQNGNLGFAATTQARTAPNGSRILQTITAPTFLTLFLEDVKGATGWEIEYSNAATGESNAISVPDGTPSNTFYVAIIRSLNPNTVYSLRARVAQFNFSVNYTADESLYGDAINVTTDRLSAFGRVEMLQRSFMLIPEEEIPNFSREIENELEPLFREVYGDDRLNLMVIRFERSASNNFLIHVEILLSDQNHPPNISALVLMNQTLYDSDIRFDVVGTPGYFFTENLLFGYSGVLCEVISNSRNERNLWTLYSTNDVTSPVNVEQLDVDGNINTPQSFAFSNEEIMHTSNIINDTIFALSQNTIYGISQNYLLRTCPVSDNSTVFYDRIYGSFSPGTAPESSRYTIFHTTDLSSFSNDSISYETHPDGRGVTLSIPSDLITRIISYQFFFNGTLIASLRETGLDDSSFYSVSLNNLNEAMENTITIWATTRGHDNTVSSASIVLTVLTDINECVSETSPHNCHENATCINSIGNFSCVCNEGFTGNGTDCTDVDECLLMMMCFGGNCSNTSDICDPNAFCVNTIGSFQCVCDSGYFGNGSECFDVNECLIMGLNNCSADADCINQNGTFICQCRDGYTGNGTDCFDINECLDMDLNNCSAKADCINSNGTFACQCQDGYTGNGTDCVDINECLNMDLNNCSADADCINLNGTFKCQCRNGTTGNGTHCANITNCSNIVCNESADCIYEDGVFICLCRNGFIGNGQECMDIDECSSVDLHNCSFGFTCSNIIGSFECEEEPAPPPGGSPGSDNGSDLSWIAAVVIIIVVLVVIVIIVVIYLRSKKKKGDRKGSYSLDNVRNRLKLQLGIDIGKERASLNFTNFGFDADPDSPSHQTSFNHELSNAETKTDTATNEHSSNHETASSESSETSNDGTESPLHFTYEINPEGVETSQSNVGSQHDVDLNDRESPLNFTYEVNPERNESFKSNVVMPKASQPSNSRPESPLNFTYVVNPEGNEKPQKRKVADQSKSNSSRPESPLNFTYVVNPEESKSNQMDTGGSEGAGGAQLTILPAAADQPLEAKKDSAPVNMLQKSSPNHENGNISSNTASSLSDEEDERSLSSENSAELDQDNDNGEAPFRYVYTVNPETGKEVDNEEVHNSEIVDPLPIGDSLQVESVSSTFKQLSDVGIDEKEATKDSTEVTNND